MPAYDFRSPRLFVAAPLAAGAVVPLDRAQAHYLTTVLRRKSGAGVLVFNGRDGEWSADTRRAKARRRARRRRQNPRADGAGRPALSVCAAQVGAARLHGAEGGGDGRLAARSRCSPATARWRASISSACGPTPSKPPSNAAFFRCRRSPSRPRFLPGSSPRAIRRASSCSATRTPRSPIRSPRCPRCRGTRRLRC